MNKLYYINTIFWDSSASRNIFLYSLCLAVLAAFVHRLAVNNLAIEPVYKHASLMVNTGDASGENRYAMRRGDSKFLFSAGAPASKQYQLVFHETADIRFKVKSRYPDQFCTETGKNQATLVIRTPIEFVRKLLDKPETELTIRLLAGDQLRVKLVNPVETKCGQATVILSRVNNTPPLGTAVAFLLIWIAMGLLLTRYSLGCLGLYGAVIHAWYMYSDALYQQAPDLAMGATGLVIMAGIGVVLLPYIERRALFLVIPLFIIVTLILVIFPLINTGNFWLTGSPVDADVINAIFQTHPDEILQFLDDSYSLVRLIVVAGSIALCTGLIAWRLTKATADPCLASLGIVFLTLAVLSEGRIIEDIPTFSTWRDASIRYYQELKAFRDLAATREMVNGNFEIDRNPGERVTVLVIGESHNKQHMSLYGYPRDTTPNLVDRSRSGNLVVFERAYSNHTHTIPSLSLALTEANQYNEKSWATTPSLVTLARQAGIRTYWISNQQMLGLHDNVVALIAKESDDVVSINKKVGIGKQANRPDEDLIPYLRNALSEPGEKLIVLHLIGSHSSYCSRVPDNWRTYSGELDLYVFGEVIETTNQTKVNCYDSTIRYNDYILNSIFNSLQDYEIPASVLYFADHSEDIFNGKYHNSANFDFSMSEIPLLITASSSWRKQFPGHWEQLVDNRKKIFTNDLIFETVLGLMGLEGKGIDTGNDLGHENFAGVEMPKTLHGKKNLKDASNHKLWQQINADLIRKNFSSRLYPHRVNTLGKILEITNQGIRSFETDVLFRSEGGFFEVGHHEGVMTGMALESFLEKIPQDFEKIWLDVKGVTDSAVPGINKRLLELDRKFGLKHRIIVETAMESSSPALLSDSGFHLSYYLPTKEILAVMEKNVRLRKNLAEKIAGIAKAQNVSAVSFNLRLYRFVKDYLEAELGSHVVYHTWFPGVSFGNSNLLEEMQAREYFHDSRVKTVLLPYASLFSL